MKNELGPIALRQLYETLVATLYMLVILSLVFPIQAFHLQSWNHAISETTRFSHEEGQVVPRGEQGENNPQPRLRRYEGGMIRPTVIAAQPSSKVMRVDGQDISLFSKDGSNDYRDGNNQSLRDPDSNQRTKSAGSMFRPYEMFRPPVVPTSNDGDVNDPVTIPRTGSLDDPKYLSGEKRIEESVEETTVHEDDNQLLVDAVVEEQVMAPIESVLEEKKTAEVVVNLKRLEVNSKRKIYSEAESTSQAGQEQQPKIETEQENSALNNPDSIDKETHAKIQSEDEERQTRIEYDKNITEHSDPNRNISGEVEVKVQSEEVEQSKIEPEILPLVEDLDPNRVPNAEIETDNQPAEEPQMEIDEEKKPPEKLDSSRNMNAEPEVKNKQSEVEQLPKMEQEKKTVKDLNSNKSNTNGELKALNQSKGEQLTQIEQEKINLDLSNANKRITDETEAKKTSKGEHPRKAKIVQGKKPSQDSAEAVAEKIIGKETEQIESPSKVKGEVEVKLMIEKEVKPTKFESIKNVQEDKMWKMKEQKIPLGFKEKKNSEEIESVAYETKVNAKSKPKKNKKTSSVDVSSIAKEEDRKMKEIQEMIQKRKQQQVELTKLEQGLLRQTIEIKKRKEEYLRLEKKTALLDDKSRQSIDTKEEIPSEEMHKTIPYYTPKEYSALPLEEKKKLKEARAALKPLQQAENDINSGVNTDSENPVHPILGPVIVDLGYKRIHIVSSGRLGTIPVWKKQRTYRIDRAKRMAAEKASNMHLGFPGVICLHEDIKGKLIIIDGQHRVGMMQALREARNKVKKEQTETEDLGHDRDVWKEQEQYFQDVIVEVYSDASMGNATLTDNEGRSYVEQLYTEINKAEPMRLVNITSLALKNDRIIVSEALLTLQHLHSAMFSPSQRCRSPDVNMNNLCNFILGSNLLQKHKNELTNGKTLADWLILQNAAIGELYESDATKRESIEPKAWSKASKNGFYLGLDNSWLYE